jgi:capsular polysaccharide biosynthesis protein
MLPRAYFGKKYLRSDTLRYVVPITNSTPLNGVIDSSLAMLGIEPCSLTKIGPQPHRFRELVLIDGLTTHGVYMSPLVFECINSLAAQVPPEYVERLYVSRASVGFRNPTAEAEIRDLLESHGYLTISPGELALSRQIAFFKGARRVVGVMGAAMTNIAFCSLGARIVCLTPSGMPDTFFWFISNLRGLNYHEVRCSQTGAIQMVAAWDTDLTVDIAALRQLAL